MKSFKKLLSMLTAMLIVLSFAGCGKSAKASSSAQTKQSAMKTVNDMSGKPIQVPANIQRIADAWPAHNEVLTMLGAGQKIVATILTKKQMPWLYKVNPQLANATTTFTKTDVNVEELVKTKPDIAFIPSSYNYAKKVTSLGITVVELNFTNFDELKKCFEVTGDILGNDAKQKAQEYNSYLDSKLKMITDITSKIPDGQKPRVLHINTLSPLTVDGSKTIIDSWISAAGGINVASDIKGNMKEASMEQILKWNPDVIILGPDAQKQANVIKTGAWLKVAAVKNGKVYNNPEGAYMWDRYSAEEALQIQWAAKILHPDKFASLDINKETINFYKEFLNYNLTDDEAKLIISGKSPVE